MNVQITNDRTQLVINFYRTNAMDCGLRFLSRALRASSPSGMQWNDTCKNEMMWWLPWREKTTSLACFPYWKCVLACNRKYDTIGSPKEGSKEILDKMRGYNGGTPQRTMSTKQLPPPPLRSTSSIMHWKCSIIIYCANCRTKAYNKCT